MSLKWIVLAVLPLAACDLGTCRTVQQEGPGLSGTLAYTLADGTRLDDALDHSFVEMIARDAVQVHGHFDDEWGRARAYDVTVRQISAIGVIVLADHGAACLPRQSGGEPICAPLAGTIDVRALAADCYEHESGIGACAETIDLTLHAQSAWEGTVLAVDADMLTTGSWVDTECDD
jgi:hypothetical protein